MVRSTRLGQGCGVARPDPRSHTQANPVGVVLQRLFDQQLPFPPDHLSSFFGGVMTVSRFPRNVHRVGTGSV